MAIDLDARGAIRDDDLDARLRALDPSPAHALDAREHERSRQRMLEILATPRSGSAVVRPIRSDRPDRFAEPLRSVSTAPPTRRARWMLLPVAAAAAVALAVTVTTLTTSTPASAASTWTPRGSALTPTDSAAADGACRSSAQLSGDARPVLQDRRGDWAVIAYAGPGPDIAQCLVYAPAGSGRASDANVSLSSSSAAAAPVYTGTEFSDPAITSAVPGHFVLLDAGSWFPDPDETPISIVTGYVGPDVAALRLTTPDGVAVDATIDDGYYSAWWPGSMFADDARGIPHSREIGYALTAADGTVFPSATPAAPR